MDDSSIPLWSYEGSRGAFWTPEEVLRTSLQIPAGQFPTTTTTGSETSRDGVCIGDTTVREAQESSSLHDYYLYGSFQPPYEQEYAAVTDCVASSASSHDSIPCTPAYPPRYIIPRLPSLEYVRGSEQTLIRIVQPDPYDTHFYTLPRYSVSTVTPSTSWTVVHDHGHRASAVAPREGDVVSGDIYDSTISDIDFDLDAFVVDLESPCRGHTASSDHTSSPTSAVATTIPAPLEQAFTTTSRLGRGYREINHHGGEEHCAASSSSSVPLIAGQHPWSTPFFATDATSSFTSTPLRSPHPDLHERRSLGSVREIVQQDYGKPNHRRISYGPNGVSLVDALRGVPYGDSDRIAFEGVEMSQKMSVRYQFKKYRVHKPQVNVLRWAHRKMKQPTYHHLARIAAKEMQRFMDKNKDFPYEWRDLVLLHIDLVSKGSLQPRIGVRLPLS